MDKFILNLLDKSADFMAERPGFLPLLAIGFILLNFLLQIFPGSGWIVESNLFLHFGLVIGIIGLLIIRALG
ncbi:MAG: hypothetical protein GWO38_27375 [Phycisphaerae bacterium]|nr:hypothetical protein [Phycisphaerae bacterium]NIX31245.1 hypothetical protein [Phycisphaerae bacterium]